MESPRKNMKKTTKRLTKYVSKPKFYGENWWILASFRYLELNCWFVSNWSWCNGILRKLEVIPSFELSF